MKAENIIVSEEAYLAEQTPLDIDGNHENEIVEMYVTPSPVQPNGELVWDDSHFWQLLVKDGDNVYPLFNDHSQFGLLKFWTYSGESPSILLLVDGNGTNVVSYKYDKDNKSFLKEINYQSEGIPDYRSRFPENVEKQDEIKKTETSENKPIVEMEVHNFDEEKASVLIRLPNGLTATTNDRIELTYYTISDSTGEYKGEFGTVHQGSDILEATLDVDVEKLIDMEEINTSLGKGKIYKAQVAENWLIRSEKLNSGFLIYVHIPVTDYFSKGQRLTNHLILEVESEDEFESVTKVVIEMLQN